MWLACARIRVGFTCFCPISRVCVHKTPKHTPVKCACSTAYMCNGRAAAACCLCVKGVRRNRCLGGGGGGVGADGVSEYKTERCAPAKEKNNKRPRCGVIAVREHWRQWQWHSLASHIRPLPLLSGPTPMLGLGLQVHVIDCCLCACVRRFNIPVRGQCEM